VVCRVNGAPLSHRFHLLLERMFEFIAACTRPDGSVPQFGDADDGRLFRYHVTGEMNDHRDLLSAGAVLFRRGDFKARAGRFSQDALWLFGGEGFESYQRLSATGPVAQSRAFPQGGFYVLESPNAHITFDAGDIGQRGRGGHGHNDTLSFELWIDGAPLIVDPGTYCYTADQNERQAFRSVRSHNTISVDGREPAEFAGLWEIREDRTDPKVLTWEVGARSTVIEAEHRGFHSGSAPVTHRRRLTLHHRTDRIEIIDVIEGIGEHDIESSFCLVVGASASIDGNLCRIRREDGREYQLTTSVGRLSAGSVWYSPSYGRRLRTTVVRMRVRAGSPLELHTVLERMSVPI
jgi:hypothetical protein